MYAVSRARSRAIIFAIVSYTLLRSNPALFISCFYIVNSRQSAVADDGDYIDGGLKYKLTWQDRTTKGYINI